MRSFYAKWKSKSCSYHERVYTQFYGQNVPLTIHNMSIDTISPYMSYFVIDADSLVVMATLQSVYCWLILSPWRFHTGSDMLDRKWCSHLECELIAFWQRLYPVSERQNKIKIAFMQLLSSCTGFLSPFWVSRRTRPICWLYWSYFFFRDSLTNIRIRVFITRLSLFRENAS